MLLAVLAGCMGPSDETRIEELRLVALRTDPAAVEVGEGFTLTLTVADPLAEGGEVLVWSCVPEVGCASELRPLAEQLEVGWMAAGPLPLWALACAPGRCGDLSGVADEDLQDPTGWLQELPITGVSAGFRTVPVAASTEGTAVAPRNPTLEQVPDEPVAIAQGAAEEGAVLSFVASGAETAYGYATSGGFSAPSYGVSSSGEVELTWFAAEEPAPARLYVVFEDGLGGVAVWIGDAG